MSRIFYVPVPPSADHDAGIECQIYADTGRLLASHLMTIDGAEIRMHDMQAAIADARKGYNTHYHVYADGREFGSCYSHEAALETVATYRAEYPHTHYRMRKVWRCPGQIQRANTEGATS